MAASSLTRAIDTLKREISNAENAITNYTKEVEQAETVLTTKRRLVRDAKQRKLELLDAIAVLEGDTAIAALYEELKPIPEFDPDEDNDFNLSG